MGSPQVPVPARAGRESASAFSRLSSFRMLYPTKWRLALAADRLRDDDTGIGRIAKDVGYDSEASFTRALGREFGLPPASWRRKETRVVPQEPP